MLSFDTNIIVYAQNTDCPQQPRAMSFLANLARNDDVVICELVLLEVYLLLRNPAVLCDPMSAAEAAEVCEVYRRNPCWRVVECAPVMSGVWRQARTPGFARRRIIDLRLALTLQHYGVTEFATVNTRDFEESGFSRVWDPLA